MKIVTIGTGMIVENFIDTAKQIELVEIVGCYSRELSRAEDFSNKRGVVNSYDSFSTIVADDQVDTIYIASPNALHYKQAKYFLENNKNVIIEKPLMTEAKHAKELLEIAKKNKLFIFEAISNVHTPNFKFIKEYLPKLGKIKLVQANYSQYSSRYDIFKEGKTKPNIFNPEFSGGALMDLNIYNIQLIYNLFGKPNDVNYFPNIREGIDTSGILVMDYKDFKTVSSTAKDSESFSYFQVQGDKGYIISRGPTNELKSLYIKTADEEFEIDYNLNHRLHAEIVAFGEIFKNKDYKKTYEKFEKSIDVVEILEKSWEPQKLGFKDIQ